MKKEDSDELCFVLFFVCFFMTIGIISLSLTMKYVYYGPLAVEDSKNHAANHATMVVCKSLIIDEERSFPSLPKPCHLVAALLKSETRKTCVEIVSEAAITKMGGGIPTKIPHSCTAGFDAGWPKKEEVFYLNLFFLHFFNFFYS